jgi:hypothetical protein
MAKHSFKLVGNHAINVLARLAAKNAIKEQMRGEGVRMTLVPPRVIAEKAQRYLEQHPELFKDAYARAKRMGWIKEPLVTGPRIFICLMTGPGGQNLASLAAEYPLANCV